MRKLCGVLIVALAMACQEPYSFGDVSSRLVVVDAGISSLWGESYVSVRKLDEGQYDAIILAVAGLTRMEMSDRIHQILPPEVSLHAVGQGALGIECRSNDPKILDLIKTLEHAPTAQRCYAERAFLRELEGGCQVPIGVNTSIDGSTLTLVGLVASLDGQTLIKDTISGSVDTADEMGTTLAKTLREQGAQDILDAIAAELRQE
ncbi:MAG: hypothetical protein F6K16_43160 [Symploca sp. SIO2B6]|nr:hypothetical protein [Symploca sp. SIO2B6]